MTIDNKQDLFVKLRELRARLLGELSAREGMEYISKLPTEALIAEAEEDGVDFSDAIQRSLQPRNETERNSITPLGGQQHGQVLQFPDRRDQTDQISHGNFVRKPIVVRAAADDGMSIGQPEDHAPDQKAPDVLATLSTSQGPITILDNGTRVFVTFDKVIHPSIVEFGAEKRSYSLRRLGPDSGYFEIENLSSGDAEEFVALHLQSPDMFPIEWK